MLDEGLANPVLLGKAEELRDVANDLKISIADISIVDPENSDELEVYAERYLSGRPNANIDRKSTRLNSSHSQQSRMPSSA